MKKRLIPAALCALAAACTSSGALYESGNPPAVRMVASEILRNPSPTNLDGIPAGKVKWNYTTGLELLAIADAGRMYGIEEFTAYAERYFDTIVRPGGEVLTYRKTKYNLDHLCPGRALFELYDRTGDVRYKMALDTLYAQLQAQPRNADGGFWHKEVYPHQMWLDGLYMAQPFYAEYAVRNLSGGEYEKAVDDIVNQFVVVAAHTYDPATGLYRHAYDDSREMFWCDKTTGSRPCLGPCDGVVRHGHRRDAAIPRRRRCDAADGRDSEPYLRGAAEIRRSRDRHVVSGARPAGPRGQLPRIDRLGDVRLRHAQGRAAGLPARGSWAGRRGGCMKSSSTVS